MKGTEVNSINTRERLGAMATAVSITLGIVWALSSYAYSEPTVTDLSHMARKAAQSKTCS